MESIGVSSFALNHNKKSSPARLNMRLPSPKTDIKPRTAVAGRSRATRDQPNAPAHPQKVMIVSTTSARSAVGPRPPNAPPALDGMAALAKPARGTFTRAAHRSGRNLSIHPARAIAERCHLPLISSASVHSLVRSRREHSSVPTAKSRGSRAQGLSKLPGSHPPASRSAGARRPAVAANRNRPGDRRQR
jgi:hypothetical protein